MDTRSGELFDRDEAGQLVPNPARTRAEHLATEIRMQEAEARGELVPISDKVAQLIRDGEIAQGRRRRRKRKAARIARKRNRSTR